MNSRFCDVSLPINVAAIGDTTLVAASASQSCKVQGLRLSAAGAVVVTLKRGSTVLEVFNFAGVDRMSLPLRFQPYYQTASNEALIINLSGAVQCNGALEYTVS